MARPLTCFLVKLRTSSGLECKVVDANPFMIGRALDATLPLTDTNVSRNHLLVKNKGGKVWLEDQGSANGTFVNGRRLEPKRLTPIEPGEEIKLGKTEISLNIEAIERVFAADFVTGSKDLSPEQKDSLLNLIHGAHSEAQRLVAVAREIHDSTVKTGEEKAAAIERNMAQQRDQILAQADQRAEDLVAEAKARAKDEVGHIHSAAEDTRRMAEDERRQVIEQASLEARAAATAILEAARIKADREAQEQLKTIREEALRRVAQQQETEMHEHRIERARLETELGAEEARRRADLEASACELKEIKTLIDRQKKVAAEEIAYQRELFEKELKAKEEASRKAIEVASDQSRQEIEKLRVLREEEAQTNLRETTLALERIKQEKSAEISQLSEELKSLRPAVENTRSELALLKGEEDELSQKLEGLEQKSAQMNKLLKDQVQIQEDLRVSCTRIEEDVGRLALERQSLETKINGLTAEWEQKVATQSSLLSEEFSRLRRQQQDDLDRVRLEEVERLRKNRQEAVEEFVQEKGAMAAQIASALFDEWHGSKDEGELHRSPDFLESKISAILDGGVLSLLSSPQGDAVTPAQIRDRKKRERRAYVAQGIVAGAVLILGLQFSIDKILSDSNPMKTAAEEKARAREEDLARRKYSPPQDSELRDSYKDAVIFTKDFVVTYVSPDFQRQLLKGATGYLLKQWRIEEEKSIEALSRIATLVRVLADKKESIHPDYIQDGLREMDALEAETQTQVQEILGSEVRYEAYRKFERKFYLDYIRQRAPANEP